MKRVLCEVSHSPRGPGCPTPFIQARISDPKWFPPVNRTTPNSVCGWGRGQFFLDSHHKVRVPWTVLKRLLDNVAPSAGSAVVPPTRPKSDHQKRLFLSQVCQTFVQKWPLFRAERVALEFLRASYYRISGSKVK